jgi:hypothetical protein
MVANVLMYDAVLTLKTAASVLAIAGIKLFYLVTAHSTLGLILFPGMKLKRP